VELLMMTKHKKAIELMAKAPILPWLFVFSIPMTGFILEYVGFKTAFLRSGVIMIILALSIVYLNHFILKVNEDITHIQTMLNSKDFDNKDIQKVIFKDKSKKDKSMRVESVEDLKVKIYKHLVKLRKVNSNLIEVEFLSGVAGTMIWGFGDLFFKY